MCKFEQVAEETVFLRRCCDGPTLLLIIKNKSQRAIILAALRNQRRSHQHGAAGGCLNLQVVQLAAWIGKWRRGLPWTYAIIFGKWRRGLPFLVTLHIKSRDSKNNVAADQILPKSQEEEVGRGAVRRNLPTSEPSALAPQRYRSTSWWWRRWLPQLLLLLLNQYAA